MTKRFAELFGGLDRAYGEYTVQNKKGAKSVGRAQTLKEQVTDELFEQHLAGKKGIGIIPIKDNNKCTWGAIDIDSYENFDPKTIADQIEENGWPLVTCRSKSGGAHVFIFTSQDIPANIIRNKLKEFAIAFGFPNAEIFPKQNKLYSKDDIGNWINLPYFDQKRTTRYAVKSGEALPLEGFIELAEANKVSLADLYELEPPPSEFSDAPPCLEVLTAKGFPDGSRNNALFDMGVYARMKFPEDWQRHIHDYNERFMGPGAPKEVHNIIKQLDKKKYTYKCQEDPICGVCNKVVCASRQYGIQSSSSPYRTSQAQKTMRPCILDEVEGPVECYLPAETSDDEPYWVFKFRGRPMDVSIDMVQSQSKFLREYLKKFRKVILAIDETRWSEAINLLLEEAIDHELAPDAGPEGQFFIHLETFLTGKVQAREKDELLLGKPWRDVDATEGFGDRIYFRSPDLMKYLDQQRFKQFKERQLYGILRRKGARHHRFMIKGKCVSCWSVTPFDEQTEGFDVPEMEKGDF